MTAPEPEVVESHLSTLVFAGAFVSKFSDVDTQLRSVVAHAQRAGVIVNSDVRGRLGIDSAEALRLLEAAVTRGYLSAMRERGGRRCLPTPQGTDALR